MLENLEYNLIDAFKPLEEEDLIPSMWKTCPTCQAKPRVWIFDNGRFAACKCFRKYEDETPRAESIMSYAKRHNGNVLEYDSDGLRKAWAKYIETGKIEYLPQGQW